MGKRIEQVFKSLLGRSGYSEKASNEVWKWYGVLPKKSKTLEKWHSKAMLIDPRKTKITIIDPEEVEPQDLS